jgi:hypothetical protein
VNINALRDTDNDPGFYVVACGQNAAWKGATLYQSLDGGTSFSALANLTGAASIGTTLNALGDFGGGNLPDELNELNVRMTFGTLSTVSHAAFLQGQQQAVIGDEIVYFREAVLNWDGTYTLRGFLRGRRGSEYAMGSHAEGERFVLLNAATLRRIPATTADIGLERLYKAVTAGASPTTVTARPFKNEGAALKPYAPVHVGGGRMADGSIIIHWTRRNRLSGEWRDGVDVPMSETGEWYDLEICDSTFETVISYAYSVPGATYTYVAADQISDFGELQSTLYVRIYQKSAVVGRGYAATAII